MKLLAALGLITLAGIASADTVAHVKFKRGKARYHAVIVDTAAGNVEVKTVVANGGKSAWKMIGQSQPLAAMTGTFFAPRGGIPVADVLVDGDLRAQGNRGSGLGVNFLGGVEIFDAKYLHKADWDNYQYGLRGAVRVVSNGIVMPNPRAQKFRDRRIWGRASRTGVGVTKAGKMVMIATASPVTLSEFGKAMLKCGVVSGLSLDGGSSTCLYYNGKMLLSPKRRMTNLLVVNRRPGPPITQNVVQAPSTIAGETIATVRPMARP